MITYTKDELKDYDLLNANGRIAYDTLRNYLDYDHNLAFSLVSRSHGFKNELLLTRKQIKRRNKIIDQGLILDN